MRVGVLLPRYDLNQLAYECITSINKHIGDDIEDDYTLFYENLTTFCVSPLCAAMTPDEICLYNDGILISTNLSNLEMTIKTINTSQKVLYLADIEWVRSGYRRNYMQNHALLNTDVKLICRSESHKHLLSSYCDRVDIDVMENFDIPKIASNIKRELNGEEKYAYSG